MRFLFALIACALASAAAWGQTSFPMITHAHPVAVQRGQTSEVEVFNQQNLFGAYQVLFDGPGLKAEIVPQKTPEAVPPAKPLVKSIKLKLTVENDAPLGVREFRVATSLG